MTIQVETQKDKTVVTSGVNGSGNSGVEIVIDRHPVEIPEKVNTGYDSDGAHHGSEDILFLANPSKLTSTPREPPPPPPVQQEPEMITPLAIVPSEDLASERNIHIGGGMFDHNSSYQRHYKPEVVHHTEDQIREAKSRCIYEYNKKNPDGIYNSRKLTMDDSLDDIKNTLTGVITKREMEGSLGFWRTGIVFAADMANQANSHFDPFEVDMTDWSKQINYDVMVKNSYDDVLEELIVKYRGKMPLSPEMKLLGLLVGSFGMGVMAQKRQKHQVETLKKQREYNELTRRQMEEMQARMAQMELSARRRKAPTIPPPVVPEEVVPRFHGPPPTRPKEEPSLAGPSVSAEEMKKALESQFIDETVISDVGSVVEMEITPSVEPAIVPPKKRGRPPKHSQPPQVSVRIPT